MSDILGNQLHQIKIEMFELIGHEFNLNSPKQLSELLFNELNLPSTRKTKSGFSTDAQSLDDLKTTLDLGNAIEVDPRSYEVLSRILEFREISKIKSTYVDALPSLVNKKKLREFILLTVRLEQVLEEFLVMTQMSKIFLYVLNWEEKSERHLFLKLH